MQCIGPGPNGPCERQVHNAKRQMCKSHYSQWHRGKPLTVLGPNGGGNKKYQEGDTCEFEPCTKYPNVNYRCWTHEWQIRKYGRMWMPGTENKETRPVNKYSTEHTCHYCGETKSWRSFVMGTDNPVYQCRACYRERLLKTEEEEKKDADFTDILAFIDKAVAKKSKNRTKSERV